MKTVILILLTAIFSTPINDECYGSTELVDVLISESPPSINPIDLDVSEIYSSFGMRIHPITKNEKFHGGIDFKAALGTPVVAPSAGIVINAGYHEKKGNWVELKHDEAYSTMYFHLSKIDVEVDQQLTIGTKIGEVGNSGLSTRPHLHYEVIKHGKRVDPKRYLTL